MRHDPRDQTPERTARPIPARDAHARAGRRPPKDQGGPRRPFQDRLDGALVDVGIHRAVAYRDIVDAHFGGHPYAARRGIDKLKRAGLLEEQKAKGPQGGTFSVLTATREGAQLARKLAARRGYDPAQQAWSGLGRGPDLVHDLAIYRAVRDTRDRLAAQNKSVVSRIRLDAELRSTVARRSERVRATHGSAAADTERRRAAREQDLPVEADGRVLYPDAQIEYLDSEGREGGRVNIEIATEHYRESSVAQKAAAGFAVSASGPGAGRAVAGGLKKAAAALAKADRSGGGGGGRSDDPASVEL